MKSLTFLQFESKSTNMIPPKKCILTLVALLGSVFVLQVLASVDDAPIDLSRFKLRHVDTKSLARERVSQSINDLATGALYMRESLIVDCNYIKCPAYGHLFKLIRNQQSAQDLEESKVIRQSTIESLALVATYDRVFYHKIFVDNAHSVSASQFMEAMKSLEADKPNEARNSDTWLDLASCLSEYMSAGQDKNSAKQVQTFLSELKRAKALASLTRLKSIPVDVGGEQTPVGLVANLVRKFDRRTPGRPHFSGTDLELFNNIGLESDSDSESSRPDVQTSRKYRDSPCPNKVIRFKKQDALVSSVDLIPEDRQNLNDARELIESLDDEYTTEARRNFVADPDVDKAGLALLDDEATKEGEARGEVAKQGLQSVNEGLAEQFTLDRPVKFIVPLEEVEDLFDKSEDTAPQSPSLEYHPSKLSLDSLDREVQSSVAPVEVNPFDSKSDEDKQLLQGEAATSDFDSEIESKTVSSADVLFDPEADSAANTIDADSADSADSAESSTPSCTSKAAEPELEAEKLAILKLVKMRLESKPPDRFEHPLKLSMKLARDFENHWRDLSKAALVLDRQKYGAFVDVVKSFLESNKHLYGRVEAAIASYKELTDLMAKIVRKKEYRNVEEFKRLLDSMSRILSTMDPSFDVDYLRRLHAFWD